MIVYSLYLLYGWQSTYWMIMSIILISYLNKFNCIFIFHEQILSKLVQQKKPMYRNNKKQKTVASRLYGCPKHNVDLINKQAISISTYLCLLKDIFQKNKLTIRNMKPSHKKIEMGLCKRNQDNLSKKDDGYFSQNNQIKIDKQKDRRKFNNFHRTKLQHLRPNTMTEPDIIIQKYYNLYGIQRSKQSTTEQIDNNFNPIGKGHQKNSKYIHLQSTKIGDIKISSSTVLRRDQSKRHETKQFNEVIRAKTTSCKVQKQSPQKRHYLHHKKQLSLRECRKIFDQNLTPW